MGAPESNDFAVGNDGGPGAPPGNDRARGNNGGAPPGNDRARGNDGGAPENNQNSRQHGLYSVPSKALEYIKSNDPPGLHWIADKHSTYLDRAPFDDNDDLSDYLLMTCVLEYSSWQGTEKMIEEGMVVDKPLTDSEGDVIRDDSGDIVEAERESAVALPLDRVLKQVQRRLDKLGVLPSADNRQADRLDELENSDYEVVLEDGTEYAIEDESRGYSYDDPLFGDMREEDTSDADDTEYEVATESDGGEAGTAVDDTDRGTQPWKRDSQQF